MSAKLGLDATKPMKFEGERTKLPQHAVDWAREVLAGRSR
jgi:hypothetical protein